ncbi:hypothetical protein WJX74_005716 [Apatococcus lobatus]|uniref:Fungal lipase-like domain-containing protein n=1 Tax=Apatococcus lobatus TaxID=904363 RepID=A0AAW1QCS8_9CHLO
MSKARQAALDRLQNLEEPCSSSESGPQSSHPSLYPESSGQTTEATSDFEDSGFSGQTASSFPGFGLSKLQEEEPEGSSPRLQPNASLGARWSFARARRRRRAEARRQQKLLDALQDEPSSSDPWAQAAHLYRSSFSREWIPPAQETGPHIPRQRSTDRLRHQQAVEALHDDLHHDPAAHARQQAIRMAIQPSDAQLALCCLYANRYYSKSRWDRAAAKLKMRPELSVWDQHEDRKCGGRMVTFVSPLVSLPDGKQAAAAVFAFRGTKLTKGKTLRADLQLIMDSDLDLYITQRALSKVKSHMRRLTSQQPNIHWGFFATGHSLGGFTAIACSVLSSRLLASVAFESPGLTTFYHNLADQVGDDAYWSSRITSYLANPNPINMCQRHLGRVMHVHFEAVDSRTDTLHIVRCLMGTGVRMLHWALALHLIFSLLRLLAGLSTSIQTCAGLAASAGLWSLVQSALGSACAAQLAVQPAHLATTAFWTLRSAAAFVASRVGISATHVLVQHSMWHMVQAFDHETGRPRRCVEMASWPKVKRFSRLLGGHLRRSLVECFVPTRTGEGISIIFNRSSLNEARRHILPGYIELSTVAQGA